MGPRSRAHVTVIPAGRPAIRAIVREPTAFGRHPAHVPHRSPDMVSSAFSPLGAHAIDLNGTSSLLHWSFIDISVANLIVIAVMVVIFGAALLIRFPHRPGIDLPPEDP